MAISKSQTFGHGTIQTHVFWPGQAAPDIPNLATAAAGDLVVLIALHYTTREIPEWVWATFWWRDQPDTGEFAAGRPLEVKGAWRHYLMSEAYSMDTPQTNGKPHVAFNPWLEARFPSGVVSNCMTCHRRAVFSGASNDFAFLPVTRGTPPGAIRASQNQRASISFGQFSWRATNASSVRIAFPWIPDLSDRVRWHTLTSHPKPNAATAAQTRPSVLRLLW